MPYYPNYPMGINYYQQNVPYQQNTQQDGFIHVQSEAQARSWDVMPGQSRTFINDTLPYCYTKSMPLSQLEPPIFKKFRLVEEKEPAQSVQDTPQEACSADSIDLSGYMLKAEFEPFRTLLDSIKADVENIRKDLYNDESSDK